jgi:DNA-binding CsgD family transcriptional regulator
MQSSTRDAATDRLPRHLRSTLFCLLEGTSEKRAAARLGLSRHTVHGYITSLYRHFRVKSRAELLVLCLRREPRNL